MESGQLPRKRYVSEQIISKLREFEVLLVREIFYTLKEAMHLIEMWRWEYNHFRPHSSLGYNPPTPSTSIAIGNPLEQLGLI